MGWASINTWIFSTMLCTITYISRYYIYDEGMVTTVHQLDPVYDYLVVGAGSAGSVIAARLSEDPGVQVAVVEDGGQENVLSEVPGMAGELQFSDMNWNYRAHPSSTSCFAMRGNRCTLPRGHVVGGSSSINYMIYVRGNKLDYDHWEALGNPGWSFNDVLPLFKKSEGNTVPEVDPDYHGTTGPLTVEQVPWTTALSDAFLKAGQELGYSVLDVNAANQTGFMAHHGFLRRQQRCSNSKAFLRPASRRENLHVLLNTLVTKVVIDPATMHATGVMLSNGRQVEVRREVVVCAGAINTPQLLMLSGIGPAAHLRSLRIPVVKDLPVGRNLQDHVAAGVIFTIKTPASLHIRKLNALPSALQYAFLGTGPLATLGGVEATAFVKTPYVNASQDWPDVQLLFAAGSHGSDGGQSMRHSLSIKEQYWASYYVPLTSREHFSIIVIPTRPRSRGYVQLMSRNPRHHPQVVTNYLADEDDVKTLVAGMRLAWKLGKTKAFKVFGAKFYDGVVPGCERYPTLSNAAWECLARHLTLGFFHLCGTARMGPAGHPDTVVDPSLKVVGVEGLRVVDASVFPTIPSGNTNAPVTMVAERAAILIKEEWRRMEEAKTKAKAEAETETEIETTLPVPETDDDLSNISAITEGDKAMAREGAIPDVHEDL